MIWEGSTNSTLLSGQTECCLGIGNQSLRSEITDGTTMKAEVLRFMSSKKNDVRDVRTFECCGPFLLSCLYLRVERMGHKPSVFWSCQMDDCDRC